MSLGSRNTWWFKQGLPPLQALLINLSLVIFSAFAGLPFRKEGKEKYWNLIPTALKTPLAVKHVYELLFPSHSIFM